jgi:hemolysin activation/secretion protein
MTLRVACALLQLLALLASARAASGDSDATASTPPRLHDFEPPPLDVEPVLPTLSEGARPSTGALAAGVEVFVRGYRIVGNTVMPADELDALLAPYVNRPMAFEDLRAVCDLVSQRYVERGYVSSWASIPEQGLARGIVELHITEGRIESVDVETDGRLQPEYVRRSLRHAVDGPFRVNRLEQALRELNRDPNVKTLEGTVVPDGTPGKSVLRVRIAEAPALQARLSVDNAVAPSIGAERARIELGHTNLSGFGDQLRVQYARTQGLREVGGSYEVPIGSAGTRLRLRASSSRSDIVEEPFESLEIESRSATYGLTLSQPVHRTQSTELGVSLNGEVRRSKSFLLGSAFSFAEGVEEGVSEVSVLRLGPDFAYTTQRQAFALRSTLSFGSGALGASTSRESGIPDSRFFSWLTQLQYARRLGLWDAQLVARADVQLADDPLLGLEQFSLGGRGSVRGYRENEIVRDSGFSASLELRIPVLQGVASASVVELVPFYDLGRAWNRDRRERASMSLASAGIGVRTSFPGKVSAELFWASDLREIDDALDEYDLQDDGIHFRITKQF